MKMVGKQQIGIIGEGAWGTAIATVLAGNGHDVLLWCYEKRNADEIVNTRINSRYLPGIVLNEAIKPVTDFSGFVDCSWIAEAIPTQYLRSVLTRLQPIVSSQQKWILLSKGFEKETFLFPSRILQDFFGDDVPYVIVAGPTYAQELARKQVSAAVVTGLCGDSINQAASLLQSDYFKLYASFDVQGVQVSSALKNVIALALGMLDGAGYGQNTRAFFLTSAFGEMVRIAQAFGADRETLYGLSGIGDVVLTSYGGLSKNTLFGKKIGEGQSVDSIIAGFGTAPEAINTVIAFASYVTNKGLSAPILMSVQSVLEGKMTVKQMVDKLVASG